ncbi:universal stress protein Slr1101-like [Mercenaria mercenaria]|uniref:universal stress protein Slr1101-like n=1 Tax=Mercenaria mercenaria TaxID=6596 RepID=UPI00234F76AB|nr:universal stress protein Slr1101-like [Mercenaria mercenaria]
MSDQRTVVIAIEDSEHSSYAFDFYVDNVHKPGDRIVLVHVPEYSSVITDSSLLTNTEILAELLKVTEEKTQELVEKYALKMEELRVSGSVKQQTGTPGKAIVEAVKEERADLLILGSRGRGFIRRTFLGSISDYCLHHCNVPVIVCRHKKFKCSQDERKQ